MHPDEEATIRAFISQSRRNRWLEMLASPKRRKQFLDRLNHCRDFDERYAASLPSNANVLSILKGRGAPDSCYVISDIADLDRRECLLSQAVEDAAAGGWGTLISCLPGKLAYYYDECGERRLLLERK
jgi:hypothetical protein